MPYNCIMCGAEGSVKEYETNTMPRADFANIDLFPETMDHTFNVLYGKPPWRCESCKSVYFRASSGKERTDIERTCNLCNKGKLKEFENVNIGEVVVKNTFEKVGIYTVDEAIVCDGCGFVIPIETGSKTE